ncbi:Peptidase M15 [Leptospira interrogans serovar Manilae]|uniref:Peptidase M15 n=1 Tax=Leptospira interrogans serovar Manilae TaxID=214675 RepID=A0AAQ1SQ70_LEPIR|nr:D-Ala-D-Ala carboxypeptidase family metallohydrolase [Leptospira interrogans]AKP25950.1 peptidase M15 [Leptospira interrogans serovar Manilae]AKP29735.1 peptidase M15 [Leptospira interrogans serovar Manilae]EYU62498.1 peptidase M15 [Leptospira interrogans serovar Manilae]SOR63387.1 Peptidase M15 [Leptospira interrogans serovar Manilae]
MNLSKNFTLEQLTVTETGLTNEPDERSIESLKRLCETILEPLFENVKLPISVSSGYRSPEVNRKIKGSITSQHMRGEAVDFGIKGMSKSEICKKIIDLNLPYHQLINEGTTFGATWIHVSIAPDGVKPKKEFLNANGVSGKMKYQRVSIG